MIDIHTHILPFLDDGSDTLAHSLEMVKKEEALGVKDVILTPHHRFSYKHGKKEIEQAFDEFVKEVKKSGIDVNLYLGQELLVDRHFKEFIDSGELITLNGSKYVLIEFSLSQEQSFLDPVYEFVRLGYKPIVAHLERYFYADLDMAYQIKELGGLIQVNARSVIGKDNRKSKKLAKQFLKAGLVDFVASDVHYFRDNALKESYQHVLKKYGQALADEIFNDNAQKILKG